jgi:hypothetical protein
MFSMLSKIMIFLVQRTIFRPFSPKQWSLKRCWVELSCSEDLLFPEWEMFSTFSKVMICVAQRTIFRTFSSKQWSLKKMLCSIFLLRRPSVSWVLNVFNAQQSNDFSCSEDAFLQHQLKTIEFNKDAALNFPAQKTFCFLSVKYFQCSAK